MRSWHSAGRSFQIRLGGRQARNQQVVRSSPTAGSIQVNSLQTGAKEAINRELLRSYHREKKRARLPCCPALPRSSGPTIHRSSRPVARPESGYAVPGDFGHHGGTSPHSGGTVLREGFGLRPQPVMDAEIAGLIGSSVPSGNG